MAVMLALALAPVAEGHGHRQRHHARVSVVRAEPVEVAQRDAAYYWGVWPCDGVVRTVWAPITTNEHGEADEWVAMRSSWHDENGKQPFSGCVVTINSAFWGSRTIIATQMWVPFVTLMIHEYGHLLGYPHSSDPFSPMNPAPAMIERFGLTLWS
jgi:hypothetical protein